MYRAVVVAFMLLSCGCAGTFGIPTSEGSKTIQQAKTVGVVSAVGHKFALQKIGITVFGNELNEVAIDSWGIDDAVVSKVGALLSTRYTVKRIAGGKDYEAKLDDFLRSVATSQKADLYIAVVRSGVPYGTTNQTVAGLGMVETGGALNPDNVHLFAVTTVHLYDGRTFEQLAWRRVGHQIGASFMGKIINAPSRTLDRTWWPATPQAVNNEKLKAATRVLLEEGLATTIPEVMGNKAGDLAQANKKP